MTFEEWFKDRQRKQPHKYEYGTSEYFKLKLAYEAGKEEGLTAQEGLRYALSRLDTMNL